ncbi:Phosphatidylinositide phosphatase SAC1 [Morus notabilis]|uniref:Phosphatidylinositide phosphatase SAC1 n=1 Tax=Morus notabilis TaxID=981085 RepID=W9RW64_9ROSA|nr:Phosphatidylinositide phosphatase SAC1 [Morus notabilis]
METGSPAKGRFKLYEKLELQEFQEKFVIKSMESPSHGFSIDRHDGNIEPLDDDDTNAPSPSKVSTIYGVVGTIRLLKGTYIIVITSRKEVGNFLGFPVYGVTSMNFLSCNEVLKQSTSQEKRDEAHFLTLLKTVESTPGLYYSYETDITLNLQRRWQLAEGWITKPIWKQADPRFVWNKNLLDQLIEQKLDEFIIPMIQGNILKLLTFNLGLSFQTAQLKLKESPATLTLVSRRCTRRLGTRMWRRGANLEGDVANFIETEQVVEVNGLRSSLLQIRGSIPLLWEQIVDLSYKPQLRVINHEQTSEVVERHFHDLVQRYGETIALDLTDKQGDEGQLSAAFASEMEKLPDVRYISFDFHHICGSSNFDNLRFLCDQIAEDFEKQGYFLADMEGNILVEQKGIIRSNCIDCLDRTNVTQSYLAQKSLNLQLQRMGVLNSSECISMFPEDYGKFRTMWAEQGDEISLEYAGTHALKGDLDAMDLISGRYNINRNGPSPFQLNGFETLSYLPVASALVVGGLTLTSLTFQQVGRNAQQFVSSVLWAGVAAGVMAVVKANGRQFCSRPRLCGLL